MSGSQVQKVNSVGVESASSISSCEIGPVSLCPEAPDGNPAMARMPQPRAAATLGALLFMELFSLLVAATVTGWSPVGRREARPWCEGDRRARIECGARVEVGQRCRDRHGDVAARPVVHEPHAPAVGHAA